MKRNREHWGWLQFYFIFKVKCLSFLSFFKIFIYFVFGCAVSSLLRLGFLLLR